MSEEPKYSTFLSNFTVNIVFVLLIIVGAAMIPLLSLQLNPTRYLPSVTISWSWPEAPVRVVEREVTSVLEGVLSTVTEVEKITSTTRNGGGTITVEFDRNADARMKRFEIASLIRESRKHLPTGVSYPTITMNMPSNDAGTTILAFRLNGNASPSYIYSLAETVVKPEIAMVDGVYDVGIYGATPREWELLYDQDKMWSLGLEPRMVSGAIRNYLMETELGGALEIDTDGTEKKTYMTLLGNDSDNFKWEEIPIAKVGGRIIHLAEVADVKLKDQRPSSYYRINGLNTINITVSAERNVNNIKVAKEVKRVVDQLKDELPGGYSMMTASDNTVYLKEEITKNIYRAVLSVILLLLFVLAISREFKYLAVITISLVANIFIAFIFYYIFKLEIHLYSLAGITVSFGIIINNTIVMTDHIRYKKNRQVGVSLVAATMTTVGALVVIFFLSEELKVMLTDFAAVVIINLIVSLFIAILFIPALLDKIKLAPTYSAVAIKRKRRVVRFSRWYLERIDFVINHKGWFVAIAILAFGLPVFYLPDTLPKDGTINNTELTKFQAFYNNTLGKRKYIQDIKPIVNKALGGSLRLFNDRIAASRFGYYGGSGGVERTRLNVSIILSEEGLPIEDMNTTCIGLENMLAAYSEIDMFTTTIPNNERATVSITFYPEHDFSIFPFLLKYRVEDYMNGIGSYASTVTGVGQAFSNNTYSNYFMTTSSIMLTGYDYDALYGYAEDLRGRLIESGKGRIPEAYILAGTNLYYQNRKVYRNLLDMDKFFLADRGSDVRFAFSEAGRYSRSASFALNAFINGVSAPVNVRSMQSEEYDYWNFNNTPMATRTGQSVKLKDFSNVVSEITDNNIVREDQQYIVSVGYSFVGNTELGRSILERNIDETSALLPLGFAAKSGQHIYSWDQEKANYLLLFLVILIIYVICAILLESFYQPFVVICLIPFSFIGVFLVFHIFKIPADEGVFAALILLCGIVVNATLYILGDYNSIRRKRPSMSERLAYMKAFNSKIIPIYLTILATIVGLVPFLLSGKSERFWFPLAAATISGLIFSLIGLFVYQPLMLKKENPSKRDKK